MCKDCKCDYMHVSDSYTSLQQGQGKSCGRFSVSHLEYRIRSLSPVGGGGSRKLFLRFVSDDTVHHKGFSFEFFAASSSGKLQFEFFNRIEKTTGFRVEVRETVFIKYIQGTQREKYVKYVVGPLQSVGIFISPATFRKSRKTCNNAI